ncbi:host cell RNA polymerase inhibitor [Pseudomonas oryzihabitans]|uniref:host cell RNA polymerase inhibitor n=1 Tax=Pseudomonas oryzihabitans TaxID=47885 RepID=UPI001472E816|nr:host cell RNA polymerase inhibitor [Pseudomonas oryzihabitans]NMZ63404.1 host cell RNA polymerase inhibitor [Pseudomonas oryzihabitans]
MQRNANEMALKLFKATVTDRLGNIDEVPVWAANLDAALDAAEAAYGEVDRVRPVYKDGREVFQ